MPARIVKASSRRALGILIIEMTDAELQELNSLRAQLENQAGVIRDSCTPANEREQRMLNELTTLREKHALEIASYERRLKIIQAMAEKHHVGDRAACAREEKLKVELAALEFLLEKKNEAGQALVAALGRLLQRIDSIGAEAGRFPDARDREAIAFAKSVLTPSSAPAPAPAAPPPAPH